MERWFTIRHSFPPHLTRLHVTTQQKRLTTKLVSYNWNLMDITNTVATLSFDAIKAVIVVLPVLLEIGSNKDV